LRLLATIAIAIGLLQGNLHGQPVNKTSDNPQRSDSRLTNADILEMSAGGLSAEVIVAKIKASSCNFDTTPATLTKLKASGIPEPAILAMIEAQSHPPSDPVVAEGNSAAESAGKATLHFYRERAFTGSARKMPIFMDEVQIADLVNGRQFTTTVDPGKHVFRCRTKPEAIEVVIEPGAEYYLRAELIQGFTKNHWRVIQVSKEQGEVDIQKLKPLDVKDITPLARTP